MTMTGAPALHVPEEPWARARSWIEAVHTGDPLEEVLTGDHGVAAWLWTRWRSLEPLGIDEEKLAALVLGYRREVWLWLAGERTWEQCCSGLIGRIGRRLAAAPDLEG